MATCNENHAPLGRARAHFPLVLGSLALPDVDLSQSAGVPGDRILEPWCRPRDLASLMTAQLGDVDERVSQDAS